MDNLDIKIVHKPKNRHSYISVRGGVITLRTPSLIPQFIKSIITRHKKWIEDRLSKPTFTPDYKTISFLGEIHQTSNLINLSKYSKNSTAFDSFYRKKTKELLDRRISYYSDILNLYPLEIKYRKMSRAWGNCKSDKTVTFNIYISQLPEHLIDYVVVHELVHLKYMNHSRDFHALVKSALKDEASLRREFKNHTIIYY